MQLLTRHWIITDGTGHVEEVNGPGVVGKQPMLAPGESFTYTSGCPLRRRSAIWKAPTRWSPEAASSST